MGKITSDRLLDGVVMNGLHPDTFHLPNGRDRLHVGDFAKVGVRLAGRVTMERLWVKVEEVRHTATAHEYAGTLANTPVLFDAKWGDPIEFNDRHVLQINAIQPEVQP